MILHVRLDFRTGSLKNSLAMNENILVHRLRVGELTLEIRKGRNTKLLITRNDRSDTPHLLISFGNQTHEIDVHLTRRTAGAQEDYQPVARISESAVSTVIESFVPKLSELALQHVNDMRAVRPGWLAKKGYLVSYLDVEAERKMVELLAPKRRYHSKWERVLRAAGLEDYLHSELPGETIFLPSVLHELKRVQYSRPVLVGRIRGRRKPRLTAVHLGLTPKGTLKWFPLHKLVSPLMHLGESLIEELKQLVSEDKWKLIWDELHLEEIDWVASRVEKHP